MAYSATIRRRRSGSFASLFCRKALLRRRLRRPVAELGENLLVVLAERRRRRLDAWPAMCEPERRERHAETTVHAGCTVVAMNDPAVPKVRVRDRLTHGAHAACRHMARLQELF